MQYKLSHIPLIRILIPLILGILAFNNYWANYNVLTVVNLLFFVLVLVSHYTIRNPFSKKINALLIGLFLFILGGWMITSTRIQHHPMHFSHQTGSYAKGMISSPLEEKENTYKTVLEIELLTDSSGIARKTEGKLLAYFRKDSMLQSLEIGDELLFRIQAKPVEPPKNPGQFDYERYLAHKSIYQQAYIQPHEWLLLRKHQGRTIQRISNNIGMGVQRILKAYIPGKEHFTLADGILLGHRADIDVELYNAFAYTGILHILSVSGLHVGIIYVMLVFLLSFIPEKRRGVKVTKFVFIFCFIWLFTFVTGFSAACVRAAILFSLLNFGKLAKEHVHNLNLLAGAALLQLLLDPNNLFDIGFQLSYLAMLGLFIFTNPIYALFYSRFKLVDWTWKLWAASIAAQLFTVPLSIYYFGNFPTYFLLANIFAIPLSTLILWLSVALIPLSLIPFLAKIVGWIDAWVIELFIRFTYFFSNLPLGKLYNLYITPIQLMLLLIAISLLAFSVMQRKALYALATLMLFLATIFLSYAYTIRQRQQPRLVLYSIPKNFVIGINRQDRQVLLSKDSVSTRVFNYSIQNSHRIYRINKYENRLLNDSINESYLHNNRNLMVIGKHTFYFLTKTNTRKAFTTPLDIDFLVLSDNCYLNLESVKANYHYKQLILSSDNDRYHTKIYRKLLDNSGMQYVDLSEQAVEIPLD